MAMSVVYSNFCGMVVSETRGGVESDYVHDTLGSTIGLMDNTGTLTDRWEYWPYGEVVSHTGSNPTPLTFLGVIGYFKDVLDKLYYVRARHLRTDLGRWLSSDPTWPSEPAFAYVNNSPTTLTDPSGLKPGGPPHISVAQCSWWTLQITTTDYYILGIWISRVTTIAFMLCLCDHDISNIIALMSGILLIACAKFPAACEFLSVLTGVATVWGAICGFYSKDHSCMEIDITVIETGVSIIALPPVPQCCNC